MAWPYLLLFWFCFVFEKLYDGANQDDSNTLIDSWCWNNFTKLMPNTFISTSNSFYIIFRGHEGNTRKGFKATYFSVGKNCCSVMYTHQRQLFIVELKYVKIPNVASTYFMGIILLVLHIGFCTHFKTWSQHWM